MIKKLIAAFLAVLLTCCASAKTGVVLYPNAHYNQVGEAQAHQDIIDCSKKADAFVKDNPGATVVGTTIVGGGAGAAIGAVGGAVSGGAGSGAAFGAATGATIGLLAGAVKASQPSPVYKKFVESCLKEKGYDPIGWK